MPRPASFPSTWQFPSKSGGLTAARNTPSAYAAPCPVCDGLALLMAWHGQQSVECNRCGSFDVASDARPALRQQPQQKRMTWLAHARRENRDGGHAVICLETSPFNGFETGRSPDEADNANDAAHR